MSIDNTVKSCIEQVEREQLRERLRRGAIERAERDLKLVQEWFAVDEKSLRQDKNNFMNTAQPRLNKRKVSEFCKRHHIRKLSLFGSILRSDFNESSDIDVLVEFEPDHVPGLIRLAAI